MKDIDFNILHIGISNVVAVLFDINEPNTLIGAKHFIKEVIIHDSLIPIVLIGYKCDLELKDNDKKIILNFQLQMVTLNKYNV